MSDHKLGWPLAVGAVTFAAIVLWLRDRFRDLRHVPEAERKRSEQRSLMVAVAFANLFLAAAAAYYAFTSRDFAPRVVSGLVAIAFLAALWDLLNQYRKIGSKK